MNIYDIAKECGVSIATVSRVLNGSDKVRPATRDKILAVMKEANYAPSSMARGLGTGYTRMVGLLCTDPERPDVAMAIGRIHTVLREHGLTVLLHSSSHETEDKKKALDELANQGVDGILLVGSFTEADEAAVYQAARRTPVVVAGGNLNVPGVYCVHTGVSHAVSKLVEALFGRQRRNILLLYAAGTPAREEIIRGYREGYAAVGYPVDEAHIIQVDPTPEAVNTCIKQLLMQRVNFDAVIGAEDLPAVSAQKALQRIGLNMPVIGCGNSVLARCATPELTSIDTHPEQVYTTAATLLCRRMQGEEIPAYTAVSADLTERDTFRGN